jgi:hypothetical protein
MCGALIRFRLAPIDGDHTARRRSSRSVSATVAQAVSSRELWHETETNPVRIGGGAENPTVEENTIKTAAVVADSK